MHMYVKQINKSRKTMESDAVENSRMRLLFDLSRRTKLFVPEQDEITPLIENKS